MRKRLILLPKTTLSLDKQRFGDPKLALAGENCPFKDLEDN
jgi:hypothetical protein